MSHARRSAAAFLSSVLLIGAITAPAAAQDEDVQLTIGGSQEPDVLNPWLSNSTAPEFQTLLFDSLLAVDDAAEYVPRLAREVPTVENGGISEDLMTYTFKLRPDAKWHDGEAVTSEDVAFTIGAANNPDFNITQRSGYDRIVSVETPDDETVVFTLDAPNAAFLELLAYGGYNPILPQHVLDNDDFNTADFNRNPIGSGPFMLSEWQTGSHLIVDANPDYFLGAPGVDRIVYRVVPEFEALRTMMDTGEIDMRFLLETSEIADIESMADWTVYSAPATAYFNFMLNNTSPILSDATVRHALAAAVDKEAITRDLLRGTVEPHWSPIPRASWAWKDVEVKDLYDVERAAALLEEAGWEASGDGPRTKDGQDLSLKIVHIAGQPERDQILAAVQQMWQQVGIDTDVNPVDVGAFVEAVNTGDYDISYVYWLFSPDPDSLRTRYSSNGQLWLHLPEEDLAEYDALFAEGAQSADRAERRKAYDRFQDLIAERLTNVFLYNRVFYDAAKTNVQNYKPNPTRATNMWNAHEWAIG